MGQMPHRNNNTSNPNANYKYSGKELDEESLGPNHNLDLYYFGARYYDPIIGRWMCVDPLAHLRPNLNPYHYVQNNPMNRFDPDGRSDFWTAFTSGITALVSKFSATTSTATQLATHVNVQVGSASFEGNGREFLQRANQAGGEEIMSNLPSEEQVLDVVDATSEIAGATKMVCGTVALATAAVPPVSATFATAATIAGGIEIAADVTRVAITQDPKDFAKAAINYGTGKIGKVVGSAMKNTVAGGALEEVTQAAIEGATQATSGVTSTLIKDKIDEEKK